MERVFGKEGKDPKPVLQEEKVEIGARKEGRQMKW
tara:strand:+ start:705 stop:809 length:105 start_codon:yes stop_codon:yes gene_type:complete